MAELRIYMGLLTLGILLFAVQIHSQKILSDKKKCGDPQCESLMMRVSAKQDYTGPDCRFLTFKGGHEINVYYKLSGRREDLWQGSTGKAYGFFPKDTVTIEEVYLRQEIEIPAQEIDFVCLDGGEYFFENEDSVLRDNDADRDDPTDRTLPGGGHLTEESPDTTTQETPVPEAPVKESWAPGGIAGWFGIGKTKENKDTDIDGKTESLGTKNEDAEPQKPPEEAPAETSGWLGGRLKKFLPFGGQGDEPQAKNDGEYRESIEKASTSTQQTDQEPRNTQEDGEEPKSKWFNFGLRDVLGFGAKNEKKEEMRQSEEGEDKERTPENVPSQDKAMEGHLVPDQLDVSRPDQTEKTKGVEINPDIKEEDTVVTNAPEKDGHAKEELSYIKDKHGSEDHREDAMTEMDRTSQDEGGEEEEKPRTEEAGDSTSTSGSDQVDESIDVSKNIDEYSDTLSQRNDGTEMDNTFQDEGEHDKQVEDSKEHSTETSVQVDDSRDHAAKNMDVDGYSDTLSQGTDGNGLIHGVSSVTEEHAKDEVHNHKEKHQPKIHFEEAEDSTPTSGSGQVDESIDVYKNIDVNEYSDTLSQVTGRTETGNPFQDEGEHDEKLRLRDEHSKETSESGQVEDSREPAAKKMDVDGNSDTLLQGTDVNRIMHEVSSIVEEHAKDEAHNLKETHDEKPRLDHLPPNMGSGQADDSGEHDVKMNGYSDTLSHDAGDRYKPGTGNHDKTDKTDVINHEETDQPRTPPEEGREYEERLKRLENINPKKIQKGDGEQNVDDRIYSASQHIIDESGSTDVGRTSLSPKSEEDAAEGTGKEPAEDKPVCTTSMDPKCRRGPGSTEEAESQPDSMGSAEKDNGPARPQIKSQESGDNGPARPQIKSQEGGDNGPARHQIKSQEGGDNGPARHQIKSQEGGDNGPARPQIMSQEGGDNGPAKPQIKSQEGGDDGPARPQIKSQESGDNGPARPQIKSLEGGDNGPARPQIKSQEGGDNGPARPQIMSQEGGDNGPARPQIMSQEGGDNGPARPQIKSQEVGDNGPARPQIKSQEGGDNGPLRPQIKSQEGGDNDPSEPGDGSSQCDAEGGCTVTTSPDHLWKRPQGVPEDSAPIQLYAWAQAITVTLRKIISGYGEVRSRYLIPLRSQVTSTAGSYNRQW